MRARICGLFLMAAVAAEAPSRAAAGPVVVELFTSQGCSACPPADAVLIELSRRPDVVALSLHVDYWDYLGWRDRFALESNGRRQREYVETLGGRTVFTPQMVIDGRASVVGSRRDAVLEEIALAGARPNAVTISMERDGAVMRVRLTPEGPAPVTPARVLYFVYEAPTTFTIEGGENDGRSVAYANVVREWMTLGVWTGGELDLVAPAPQGAGGVAIVVQKAGGGVIGASDFDLASTPVSHAAQRATSPLSTE